jgi:hypothetical protein
MVKIWSKPLDFQIFAGACAPPSFYVAPPLVSCHYIYACYWLPLQPNTYTLKVIIEPLLNLSKSISLHILLFCFFLIT